MQGHDGEVVGLLGFGDEAAHVAPHELDDRLGVAPGCGGEECRQACRRVGHPAPVFGLDDAVGIEEHQLIRRQLEVADGIGEVLDRAEWGTSLGREKKGCRIVAPQVGRIVPCVAIDDVAGREIEHAGEDGDEHRTRPVAHQVLARRVNLRVGLSEDQIEGRAVMQCCRAQYAHAHCHEEGGRHAVAGDIGDGEEQAVLVEHEDVVEVPSHLLRRLDQRVNLDILALGAAGKVPRQEPHLDRPCRVELAFEPHLGLLLARELDGQAPAGSFGETQVGTQHDDEGNHGHQCRVIGVEQEVPDGDLAAKLNVRKDLLHDPCRIHRLA